MSIKKRKGCLIRLSLFFFVLFSIAYLLHPSLKEISYKNPVQASESISESRKNKTFIRECFITDIEVSDTSYQFPFEQAWEEKRWHLELNDNKKEFAVIDSLSIQIVFKFKRKNDYKLFFGLDHKCLMNSDSYHTDVLINGMFTIWLWSQYKDSTKLSYTIYKTNSEYYRSDDHTPLFKFNLLRNE